MIYILDFDGVVFDDQRFKKDFRRVFADHGITHRVYEDTYHDAKETRKGTYELDAHLKIIAAEYLTVDHKALRKDIMALAVRSRRYVFADAKTFLADAKKKRHTLFLVSAGDSVFQKEKINASGISSFFDDIAITSASQKSLAIDEIKKHTGAREIVFVDDNKEVLDDIKKHHPSIKTVQMARTNRTPRATSADMRIKNFSEIG